jgi:hypothetical protein
MINRSKPELNSVEREAKNKYKMNFRIKLSNVATQIAFFIIEGATIVERYCDACAKSVG